MSTAVPPAARTSGDGRWETDAASVLRAVLDHGPVARGGMARLSGLSPAAVSFADTAALPSPV